MKKQNTNTIDITGKVPPQAIDLEEAVLGAILLESESLDRIVALKPHHFYKAENQKIFNAILNLNAKNQPIDLLTVTEELRKHNELEEVGGAYYVTILTNKVASSAHIDFHARILMQKYLQRQLIRISSEVLNKSYDDSADIDEVLEFANSSLDIATNEIYDNHKAKPFSQQLKETIDALVNRSKLYKEGKVSGIRTPILDLTKATNGWQNGELIVIAARPAMGKTAFVIEILKTAAYDGHFPCLFSLEMDDLGITGRIIVGESGISADDFKKGSLSDADWVSVDMAVSKLYQMGITIDDHAASSIDYIKSKARILKKKGKCSMILIDYLQLAQTDNKSNKNREQEISEMSRKAKLMAKELDVPVIVLSQLNRGVELRSGDKRPYLADLRESGAIEQDADMVMFIYRSEYYGFSEDENGNSTKGKGEIIIAKNRNGKIGTIHFGYNESLTKIFDWVDPNEIPEYHKPGFNLEPGGFNDENPF